MKEKFNQTFMSDDETPTGISQSEVYWAGEGMENFVMESLYKDIFEHPTEIEFNKTYSK